MNETELIDWLKIHLFEIATFMDYQPTMRTQEALYGTLAKHWFRRDDWGSRGDRLVSLGQDGTGGLICLWQGPESPPPGAIVIFGSEGGLGVLATSPERFVQLVAHAPFFDPYQKPARATAEGNWQLEEDDGSDPEGPTHMLARYRAATEAQFGPLPPMDALTEGALELSDALVAWAGLN
ncbi:MAG: hypothetical protein H6742_18410 [Alphaproteobacteria bacterium]|nr:hypothetical protein [Alphaproteobacteria bacterium]